MQHTRTFPLTGDTLTLYRAEGSSAPAATTAASLALNSDTTLFLRLSLPEEQLPPDLTGTHKGFPRAAVLTSAVLSFKQNGAGDHVASSRLLLHRAAEEGDTPALPADPLLLDFEPAALTSGTKYTFDVTSDLRAAQMTGTPAMLALSVSGSGTLALGGITHETLAPSLTLTYETSYGEKTFGKTHTHTPTPHMTATHDLFRGNLLLSHEDFTGAGNRMPVSIRHCYNSAMHDRMFTKNHGIDTAHFSPMRLGLGWRLNLFESVMLIDGNYVYTDDSGNEHVLVYRENDLYATEDGNMTYDESTHTLASDTVVRTFDIRGRLVEIAEGENRMSIRYATTEDACETLRTDQIMSVTDGVGRVYTFAYTPWYLASITAPDGKKLEFFYRGDHLAQINHPDGCKTILTYKEATGCLESVSYRRENGEDIHQILYGYENLRIRSVIEFFGIPGGGYYEGSRTSYDYSPSESRLTATANDTHGMETEQQTVEATYFFASDGTVLSEYMTLPSGQRRGIESESSDITPYIGEGVRASAASVNLLKNPDLSSATHWPLTAPVSERKNGEDINVYGHKYIGLNSWNDVESGIRQETGELAAGEYNFSAFVRVFSQYLYSDGKKAEGFLRVWSAENLLLAESERIDTKGDVFSRLDVPFFLDTAQSVTVELCHHGCGQTDWAAAQLSPHAFPSPYNMLGSFAETAAVGWVCSGNVSVTNDPEHSFYGKGALCIASSQTDLGKAHKSIPVLAVDSVRESFTLSGWAKAPAYPDRLAIGADNAPVFCLAAEIVYKKATDETEQEIERYEMPFDSRISGWQHVTLSFAKTKRKDVEELRVLCCYGYRPGNAYFDGLSLVRDELELSVSSEEFARPTYGIDPESDESDIRISTADAEVIPFEEAKDAYGNPLTETGFVDGALGTLYRAIGYNATGNDPVCQIDASGNATRYWVNEATSRNEAVIDRLGNMTAYRYDERGRTVCMRSYHGNSLDDTAGAPLAEVLYGYNELDDVTEIARGDGMGYALTYNQYHRLSRIAVKGAASPLVSYSYKNGSGPLKRIDYANGDYMDANYNSFGQLIGERWYRIVGGEVQEQARYRYVYDSNGTLVRSIDFSSKKEYTYRYESGRLTETAESDIEVTGDRVLSRTPLHKVAYTYDGDGNLTKKTVFPTESSSVMYHYIRREDGNTLLRIELASQAESAHIYSIAVNDSLGRKSFDELQLGKGLLHRRFEYCDGQLTEAHREHGKVKSAPTTQLVKTITFSDGRALSYEYDAEERITKVTDSAGSVTEYTYDALGQLLTEAVNGALVNEMAYDGYGNIVEKNGKTYTYGDPVWRDLLTACDGQSIVYDAGGNPTTYLGHTLAWEKGRQLKAFDGNTYTYNANGIRTSKTAGGVRHTYALDGTKILRETWGENTLLPLCDSEDGVCGIRYNGDAYFFVKNLQGDVIALANMDGETVAHYTYDAWGVPTVVQDTSACHIAQINPYRYRGYYYDTETGLYYLQSRYYDPAVGRFLNADEALYLEINCIPDEFTLFTYCWNDPINMIDESGKLPSVMKRYLNAIKGLVSATAFSMVTNSNWMGIGGVVSQIAIAIKAVSNYKINKSYEGRLTYTPEGYIDKQRQDLCKKMRLGYEKLSVCGCEVISVYNALKACGKPFSLSDLILYFELSGYIMLYGYFGSNPTKLWKTFGALSIKYKSSFTLGTVEKNLRKSTCGIVSCWNGTILKGLHTFMVKYDFSTKLFVAYNGYNYDPKPCSKSRYLKDLVYPSYFIIGYWIG